jgi:hypothetical protein
MTKTNIKFGSAYSHLPLPKRVKFWAETIKGLMLVIGGVSAFNDSPIYTFASACVSFLVDRVVVYFGEVETNIN